MTLRNFTERSELTGIFKINQLLILINVPYTKSKCKFSPPNSHPAVEMFKQSRNSVFKITDKELGYSNFISEKWKAVHSLADDKRMLLKKADKTSCVVVLNGDDYLPEAETQLKHE